MGARHSHAIMKHLMSLAALALAIQPLAAQTSRPAGSPGDNFYAYSAQNAGANAAQADARDTVITELGSILDEIAEYPAAPDGSPLARLRDYYRADLDQAGMDARGLAPLAEALAAIDAAQTHRDIARLMGEADYPGPFAFYVFADMGEPTVSRIGIEMQGYDIDPFALPSRDHYLSDEPDMAALRETYRSHIARLLGMAGREMALASADAILALETAIAAARWTPAQLRDRQANYHPVTPAELAAYAPDFPWAAYLASNRPEKIDRIILGTDSAVRETAAIFAATPVATWREWMVFRMLDRFGPQLGGSFRQQHFDFHEQALRGTEVMLPAARLARRATQFDLPRDLGRVFAERFVSPDEKASMDHTVAMLKDSFDRLIENAAWMSPEDQHIAREKLRAMRVYVGHPDVFRDYSAVEIDPSDPVGNRLRLARFERSRQLAMIGQPIPDGDWVWGAAHWFDAANTAQLNMITMPAGMMREFLPTNPTPAQLYAKAGHVIGHEIGHGFDDQGSKFRPDGRLDSWWSQATRSNFESETPKLVAQISAYEVLPGQFLQGERMIGEALSDIIGAHMALAAYRTHCDTVPGADCAADPLARDREFFLAMGHNDGSLPSEEQLMQAVRQGHHLPSPWRLHSIVRNMDAWYAAFDVGPQDPLYLPPEQRVRLYQ